MCAHANPNTILTHLPTKSNSIFLVCKNGAYAINPPESYYGRGYLLTPKIFNDRKLASQLIDEVARGKVKLEDVCVAWYAYPSVREGDVKTYGKIINELNSVTEKVLKNEKWKIGFDWDIEVVDYELKKAEIEVIRTSPYYIVVDFRLPNTSVFTVSARIVRFETNRVPDAVACDVLKFVPPNVKVPGLFMKAREKKLSYVIFKYAEIIPLPHTLLGIPEPTLSSTLSSDSSEEVEGIEDIDLESEWGLNTLNTDVSTSAEPSTESEGTEEEKKGENEEQEKELGDVGDVDVNELVMRWIKERGLIPVTLIVFDLPSEYKGAKVKLKKVEGGFEEVRVLSWKMGKFRTLRSQFYKELRKVAWRSTAGWVLRTASKPDLGTLNSIIARLNKLAELGEEERIVEFIEVFMPRYYVVKQLQKYIAEKRASFEEFKRKAEEVKERREQYKRLMASVKELEELLKDLEEELRHIQLS